MAPLQDCNVTGRFVVTGRRGASRRGRRGRKRWRTKGYVGNPIADAVSRLHGAGLVVDFPEAGPRAYGYCPGCGGSLIFRTVPNLPALVAECIDSFTQRHGIHVEGQEEE
jgi:hypothetical protein